MKVVRQYHIVVLVLNYFNYFIEKTEFKIYKVSYNIDKKVMK